jgi:hypothetical protein
MPEGPHPKVFSFDNQDEQIKTDAHLCFQDPAGAAWKRRHRNIMTEHGRRK